MGELTHRARGAITQRERTWSLEADALHWRDEKGESGRIPFADIARLQLIDYASYGGRIYHCALKRTSGGTATIRSHSYIGLGKFEDRRTTYAPLIRALASKLAEANPRAQFIAGSTALWIVWTVVGLLTLIMLGFLFASFATGGPSLNAAAMAAVIVLLAGPLIWRKVRAGKAKSFDPANVPPELIGEG